MISVIAASASGKVCPSFLKVEGKQILSIWLNLLDLEVYRKAKIEVVSGLIEINWLPVKYLSYVQR